MRYVMPIVEQLDRAAQELAIDHPINNRLALILIDNATELILHGRCTDQIEEDKERRKYGGEGRLRTTLVRCDEARSL
jgi:hypothetical protein